MFEPKAKNTSRLKVSSPEPQAEFPRRLTLFILLKGLITFSPVPAAIAVALLLTYAVRYIQSSRQYLALFGRNTLLRDAVRATCKYRLPLPFENSSTWWNASKCLMTFVDSLRRGEKSEFEIDFSCKQKDPFAGLYQILTAQSFLSVNLTNFCRKHLVSTDSAQCPRFIPDCATVDEKCRLRISAAQSLDFAARMRVFMISDDGEFLRIKSELREETLIFADEIGFFASAVNDSEIQEIFFAGIVLAEVTASRATGFWLERERRAIESMPNFQLVLNNSETKQDLSPTLRKVLARLPSANNSLLNFYWSLRVENLCVKLLDYDERISSRQLYVEAFKKLLDEISKGSDGGGD